MTFKEIQELIKLISKMELTEFKMKDGEFELSVRTKHYEKSKVRSVEVPATPSVVTMPPVQQPYAPPSPAPQPAKPVAEAPQPAPAKEKEEDEGSRYVPIKSPIVGTFYRSPSPDKSAYVKVGDTIEVGTVVCIVEAMKLFNEIESEVAGKIVKVAIEDAQPVEYDQVLFYVDPKG